MASIEKRGKGYRIVVSNGLDRNNQQIKVSMTFYPTKKKPEAIQEEVNKAAILFEEKVLSGEYKSGEKMPFSEFYTKWEQEYATYRLSERALQDYKKIIDTLYLPAFEKTRLTKINARMIEDVLRKEIDRGVSAGTIKKDIAVLSGMFSKAVKWDLIKENPCSKVDCLPARQKQRHVHTFTIEQSKTFIKLLSKGYVITKRQHERTLKSTGRKYFVPEYSEIHTIPLQFQCLFMILLCTGIRRGECLALTWNDIDFFRREISINKATSLVSGMQITKEPKTEAGFREVTTTKVVIDMLKKWKKEQKEICIECGDSWQGKSLEDFDENFIFIQDDGKQMNLSTVGHKFREIIEYHNACCKESEKLPLIRLHDLRHTSATLLITSGTDVRTVANRLGHANPSVTLNVYAEVLKSADVGASETLDRVLGL